MDSKSNDGLMLGMKKRVCYNCDDRELGCHNKCIRYTAEVLQLMGKKEQINKVKQEENIYYNYSKDRDKRIRKVNHNLSKGRRI